MPNVHTLNNEQQPNTLPPRQPKGRRRGWFATEGSPFPLGVTRIEEEAAYNFALYTKNASSVSLLLFHDQELFQPALKIVLHHLKHKSGDIWHCRLTDAVLGDARYYAYSVDGPHAACDHGHTPFPHNGHAFDPDKLLLDPYAREVFFPPSFDRASAIHPGPNLGKAPLGVICGAEIDGAACADAAPYHEHDLIIYEVHVRGFTKDRSSCVAAHRRGTYLGIIDKIPYLQSLGVTAVELLPVHQFDPQEGNFWGYMTLNFFAPHSQYAVEMDRARDEFRMMVRALHDAGMEVLLDVVFNHTAEGDQHGPCYSFKGIDNSQYYITGDASQPYPNYSGTGNTMRCTNRYVSRMIVDCLRHWVVENHVDGFRFDLAAVFNRHEDGSVSYEDSRIISAIRADPVLGRVRLIAEPWDAMGLDQLGRDFPGKRWFQWNGRYRDDLRRFVKGDPGVVGAVMCRLYGSDDLFPDSIADACHPYQSINYINSHDGFTLYDLVSYNTRRNWANGERNQDGHRDNLSWNCGWEGDQGVPDEVLRLRKQQAKNFCCLLMLSAGTPMFRAGDEFLETQFGNNNPYNQDNEVTWLNWDRLHLHQDFFRFFRMMIAFRKSHPTCSRSRFWRDDVRWYGRGPQVDISHDSRQLAFYLDGHSQKDADLYVMMNADHRDDTFDIIEFESGAWRLVADTSRASPDISYADF